MDIKKIQQIAEDWFEDQLDCSDEQKFMHFTQVCVNGFCSRKGIKESDAPQVTDYRKIVHDEYLQFLDRVNNTIDKICEDPDVLNARSENEVIRILKNDWSLSSEYWDYCYSAAGSIVFAENGMSYE